VAVGEEEEKMKWRRKEERGHEIVDTVLMWLMWAAMIEG
jgi:hypothetical protein